MTAQIISPLVPPSGVGGSRSGPGSARKALPLAQLAQLSGRSTVCGIASIDCNGRIVEATVIPALSWAPGTRLDIRVSGGLVLVTADAHAVFCLTRPGQVRLPAAVRHWCGLIAGSRVLLTADPDAGLLVVHPPAALHTMISQFHAAVLGGEPA
jgi:hypothetical protein